MKQVLLYQVPNNCAFYASDRSLAPEEFICIQPGPIPRSLHQSWDIKIQRANESTELNGIYYLNVWVPIETERQIYKAYRHSLRYWIYQVKHGYQEPIFGRAKTREKLLKLYLLLRQWRFKSLDQIDEPPAYKLDTAMNSLYKV